MLDCLSLGTKWVQSLLEGPQKLIHLSLRKEDWGRSENRIYFQTHNLTSFLKTNHPTSSFNILIFLKLYQTCNLHLNSLASMEYEWW